MLFIVDWIVCFRCASQWTLYIKGCFQAGKPYSCWSSLKTTGIRDGCVMDIGMRSGRTLTVFYGFQLCSQDCECTRCAHGHVVYMGNYYNVPNIDKTRRVEPVLYTSPTSQSDLGLMYTSVRTDKCTHLSVT